MSRIILLGLLVLLASACGATGQDTKTFDEAPCRYTLPGRDWEWLDPQAVPKTFGKTLAAARNQNGMAFFLVWRRLQPDEKPNSRAFESFEKGFLQTSKAKKLAGTEGVFRGILTYQLDVELPTGAGIAVRIMHANQSFYMLQAANGLGPLTKADTDTLFRGFDFTADPEPVAFKKPGEEIAFAVGRFLGMGLCIGAVVGAVLGAVYLVKRLSGSAVRPSGQGPGQPD